MPFICPIRGSFPIQNELMTMVRRFLRPRALAYALLLAAIPARAQDFRPAADEPVRQHLLPGRRYKIIFR